MDENQKKELANYLKYSAEKLIAGRAVPEILLQEISQKIRGLEIGKSSYSISSLKELIDKTDDKLGAIKVTTGFAQIDHAIGGLPTSLVVIGARPGMGKTAFILSLAHSIAKQQQRVGLVNLEMSSQQLTRRMLKLVKPTDLNDKIFEYIDVLEPREYGIQLIEQMITEYCEETNPKIVFLDNLQLIHLDGYKHYREREVNYIIGRLKKLSRALDIPIVLTSQLSRAVETRGGEKRPQLSDLRESGAIEQDADMVWFIYRAAYYGITEDEDGMPTDNVAELIVAKNKLGPCDTHRFRFLGIDGLFEDDGHEDRNIASYGSFKEMYETLKENTSFDDEASAPF